MPIGTDLKLEDFFRAAVRFSDKALLEQRAKPSA